MTFSFYATHKDHAMVVYLQFGAKFLSEEAQPISMPLSFSIDAYTKYIIIN